MDEFKKIVEMYMQCEKRTLAELLALKEMGEFKKINNIEIEEPKTPKRDLLFPPYTPMPNTQPNMPNIGDQLPYNPWNPNGPWGPIVWSTTNTLYSN